MNMHDAAREILGLYVFKKKKKEKEESLTIH